MISSERLDRCIFYSMLVVGFSSCISVGLSNIATAIAAIFLLVAVKKYPDEMCNWPKHAYKPVFVAIVFFIFTMACSALFSGNLAQAWDKGLFHFIYRPLILLIVAVAVRKKSQILAILSVTMCSLLASDFLVIWKGFHGDFRAQGISGGPMWMGSFLGILLPVMLVFVMNKNVFSKYHKGYFFCFFISLVALLFNGTRGVWLAMVCILPLIVLFYTRKWGKMVLISFCAISTGMALFYTVPTIHMKIESIMHIQSPENKERTLMWKSAVQMAEDSPFFGVGLGNYSDAYQKKYIQPEAKERLQGHAHNNFMQMLGENGVVGLTGFCVMFGACLHWAWKRKKNVFAMMALGATLGFLFHGLTEYNFGSSGSIKLWWLVFALCTKAAVLDLDAGKKQIGEFK